MRAWPALACTFQDPVAESEDRELLAAALTDFDVAAIDDNAPDTWRVFFHSPESRDAAADALRDEFPTLTIAPIDVPDEDWAARSQADLTAIQVGNIIVAPPWDAERSAEALRHNEELRRNAENPSRSGTVAQRFSAALTVIIQPSMGFGTGHHATTRLCLAHLQQIDLHGLTAIDVGTGSGVLAIAAKRLGAGQVLAIDDDPDAIQSARENVTLNPGADVTLGVLDLRRAMLRPFDIVLANLTGGLLIAAAASLQQLAARGGRLILSGFLQTEEVDVLQAFGSCTIEQRSQEDEWLCVTISRLA